MDAPEKIWLYDEKPDEHFFRDNLFYPWPEKTCPPNDMPTVEYIRADIAQAMVATAYETMDWIAPEQPRKALEGLLKAEREKALREAAKAVAGVERSNLADSENVLPPDYFDEGTSAAYEAILALIDKDKADG